MMTTPLLATKLYIPRLPPALVSRPRLIERLNAGLQHTPGVTLISAPAGFGKTTLLSHWIPQAGRPVAWLSLDEHDNDPPRFFAYLVAALQTIGIEFDDPVLTWQMVTWLGAAPGGSLQGLLIPLLNRLAAAPACVLVLDDYHLIDAPTIHQGIGFLLERVPPQFHLVLSSRADPPLPLARLRARQQLTELRAADLRFSRAEAVAFFRQLESSPLSSEQIAALENRTEGWVAGLQLVAHSLQGQDAAAVAAFVDDFAGSQRYVSDYLADEVFTSQPGSVRQFLTQTAILERFTADLCDAVTGNDDGHAVLDHLDRVNLFLVALDGQRCWYRYHHLFAEFLRQQLERDTPDDEQAALHRRASQWYETHGWINDAIDHALRAGDWESAVRLLNVALDSVQRPQQYQTWQRWLAALPETVLLAEPHLCVEYAWALVLGGRLAASERPLQMAEQTWQARGDEAQLGKVYATRAFLERIRGDLPAAIALAHEALTRLPPSPARGLAAFTLALCYHQTGQVQAAEMILQLILSSRPARDSSIHLGLMLIMGLDQVAQGRLRQALQTWTEVLQSAEEGGWRLATLVARALIAQVHYEWNDLDQSAALWQTWLDQWGQPSYADYFPWLIQGLARLQWSRGAEQDAFATLAQAAHLARQLGNPVVATQIEAQQVRFWLDQGDLAAASGWLQAHPLRRDDEPDYTRQSEYLARVRVLIHQADPGALAEADQWLSILLAQAQAAGRQGDEIENLVLQALRASRANQPEQALAALEQALTLAEPEGYVRTFIDEGEPLAALLRQAAARGIAPGYVTKLLASFPHPHTPTLLSEREIQVLKLIAAGDDTGQIAERLVISVHTARTHVKSIYQKLDVHSRVQAIAKARELDLI
ncbi:MAG: helix-turn-helix transcriptional regulator [Chloroflexi bacterium]|nr:helix-turn-helix transcriptional regulator [Chloroflexota bacterium]